MSNKENFNIDNFDKNGACWPFKIKQNLGDLEKEYFAFQSLAKKNIGNPISLKPNLLSTFFDKLCFDENVIAKVREIIGEDIYIWSSAIFAKLPGEGKIVSYHQDNPYWQLSTNNVVSAWIALTDSNKNSGALEIVPGSHRDGIIKDLDVQNARESYLKGKRTTVDNDLLSYNQNLDDYIKSNPPVAIELQAGEFSIHHVNTVHGSGINQSNNPRIGFAVRYVTSDTKHLIEKSGDSAIHVCGKKNEYFTDELRPDKDFSKQSINMHNFSMRAAGAFGNKKYV